ncbi:protein of unknown function [Tenacibaculum sp. 190524A02b]|uniref:Uncharacterized protein n=1 Tax=Tenacibaculum vairaonense TaxID=3137860 RepID=A0ABP1FDP1_9FLAO
MFYFLVHFCTMLKIKNIFIVQFFIWEKAQGSFRLKIKGFFVRDQLLDYLMFLI